MKIANIEVRKGLGIPTNLDEYSNMAGNSLRDYTLSGCDTTSVLCRMGISTSHKVLKLITADNLITVRQLVNVCT